MNIIIAFQGERGAYGDEAITKLIAQDRWRSHDKSVYRLPCWTFEDVLKAVWHGKATYGLMPIENSIIGPITESQKVLNRHGKAETVDEVSVSVQHCLLAPDNATLDTITRVYSHPAALAQCKLFLSSYSRIRPVECYDTAGAARDVAARNSLHEAAIASRSAADRYALKVVQEKIQDHENNWTRFVMIARSGSAHAEVAA